MYIASILDQFFLNPSCSSLMVMRLFKSCGIYLMNRLRSIRSILSPFLNMGIVILVYQSFGIVYWNKFLTSCVKTSHSYFSICDMIFGQGLAILCFLINLIFLLLHLLLLLHLEIHYLYIVFSFIC